MIRSTITSRSFVRATSIALLASLAACASTPPGRCVGVPGAVVTTTQAKVLLNLDSQGVALQGYDAVAYFTDHAPVKGDAKCRSIRNGAEYHFASAEHKARFDADPNRYEPQFGGWCAYAASIDRLSPIDAQYWEIVDNRLILQHNKKAWDLWHQDATGNLAKADHNWPGLVDKNGSAPSTLLNVDEQGVAIQGYDPTAYFLDAKPRKGDPGIARTFQGATYYFVDAAHKDAFEKEPSKYVPQFGGFCGYAAAINKVSPVNPEIWQIERGRLVLQHTPEAYRLFNQDASANYAKADQNWPGLSRRRCSK